MNNNLQVDKTISQLDSNMNKIENNDQIISVNSEESTKSSKINIDSYLDKDQKAYIRIIKFV